MTHYKEQRKQDAVSPPLGRNNLPLCNQIQPPSSSDSEGSNPGERTDEDGEEEEEEEDNAKVPQRAASASEEDSDSGSEDGGRGGVKRKPQAPKVSGFTETFDCVSHAKTEKQMYLVGAFCRRRDAPDATAAPMFSYFTAY